MFLILSIALAQALPCDAPPCQETATAAPGPLTPPPELPPPPEIAASVLKHPRRASLALAAQGSEGTPSERQLRHVWMGRSLLAMGLVHAAGREFDAAVALGTEGPVFVNAWEGLNQIADRTGDSTQIAAWVVKIPLENFHASRRDRVAWWMAVRLYEDQSLTDARIPTGSPLHDEALLEVAWAQFMRDDLEGMTASLRAIDPQHSWLPERALLEGLAAYSQERYGSATATAAVEELEALRPVEAVLHSVLKAYTEPENDLRKWGLYEVYLEPEEAPGIPAPLLTLLKQDTELQGLISHLQILKMEEDRVQHEPRMWRHAVGDGLQAAFSADRADLESKAGEILLRHIEEQDRALVDLLNQAEILQFEVAVATHADTAGPELRALIAESQGEARSEMRFRLAQNYATNAAEEIALYEQIQEETPSWSRAPAVTLALAEARWQAGERKAALALLETLLQRWPEALEVVQARLLLGDNAFGHKDWAAARRWYGAASAGPNPAQQMYIRYRLAWCDWAEGKHVRAIETMKAVSADPADPELGKRAAQDLHRMAPDGRL